ncbi:fam-a protein [Plasmodium vinckei brucechwatti]|uniref:Fam-a protein n=1 Tax=Plasmodium vinckei brucechwatti TaxID=119398 RepID=A0A6V7RTN1_PLAVN|nr:fam-a protein [Plasmodium vinckei brucechwatti]
MNKFYIQIVFFLLSITLYVDNKTLATEPISKNATTSKSKNYCSTPEEIFVSHQHLLCTNPEETRQAHKLMNEAVKCLEQHATSTDDYKSCRTNPSLRMSLYKKKHKDEADIEQIRYTVYDVDTYNEIINEIWDPKHDSPFNNGAVKIARVYDPSLVMIQQRYEKPPIGRQKYFYALAQKTQISENITIIVMTSANINDHNPSNKEYKNPILKNAESFTTDINSEEDIREGKLTKTFVNLAGYIIHRRNTTIDIIYIESIDGHATIYQEFIIGKLFDYYFVRR